MIRVMQLIGRYRGQIVEMPFAVAQACIANGTACRPEDADKMKLRGAAAEVAKAEAVDTPAQDPVEIEQIGEVTTGADVAASHETVIPANWRDLHWKQRVKLANDLGYEVENATDADAALELHGDNAG